MSLDEIAKESSQIIYIPKADEIKYSKLTHYERKLKEESDTLRSQHSIPKNIYTQFEYNQLQKQKYNFKLRIVLYCLIEFIALSIFIIGLINNHWFVNNGVIYFVFIGFIIYIFLKEIYRQDQNSYITQLAYEINSGELSESFLEKKDDYNFINTGEEEILK